MKKILMFAIMATAALSANAYPRDVLDSPWDALEYHFSDNTAEVYLDKKHVSQDNYSRYKIKSIKIPATVKNGGKTFTVTAIGDFQRTTLKNITIPNTVELINYSAFDGTNLEKVYIRDIAAWCNIVMGSLTDYTYIVEDNIIDYTKINPLYGAKLFFDGEEVKDLIIPSYVTKINDAVFYGCKSFTSVTIPKSVTNIGRRAFKGCNSLTSVNISNSTTKIGKYAFHDTPWYYNQPTGLVYAGMVAYSYKGNMPDGTSIVLKDGCTGIAEYAFAGCEGLKEITIPSSVTFIGEDAFSGCTGLTNVYCEIKDPSVFETPPFFKNQQLFGKNVVVQVPNESVEKYKTAWKDVTIVGDIKSVDILGTGRVFVQDGISYSVKDDGKSMIVNGPEKSKEDFKGNLVIPETVTFEGVTCKVSMIGSNAFGGCTGLSSVTIPNSVKEIGNYAFEGCTNLTSIIIPNSVTEIGWNAFEGCKGMTSVTIGTSVTKIGSDAFYGCPSLTSITIPNSVTEIGDKAFRNCGLTSVTWNAKSCANSSEFNEDIKTFTFGNEVEIIPKYLCSGLSNLTSVTIPNSVKSIGESAFSGCTGLTSVTIGNFVKSIGKSAFSGCSGLTSVTIPNSVTEIGDKAFSGCTGLTSVTIKNPNIKIKDNAFYYCDKIKKLQVPPGFEAISSNLNIFPNGAGRQPTTKEINLVGGKANFNKLSQGIIQRGMKLKHIENYSDLLDNHYILGAPVSVERLWTRDDTSKYEISFNGGYDYYVIVRNGVVTSVSY